MVLAICIGHGGKTVGYLMALRIGPPNQQLSIGKHTGQFENSQNRKGSWRCQFAGEFKETEDVGIG